MVSWRFMGQAFVVQLALYVFSDTLLPIIRKKSDALMQEVFGNQYFYP
jgi:hypothetical protein